MMRFFENKKGQSAIEIAIIFPVMAFLMIYLFDVAKVINAKMTINTANRTFMRIITINGAPPTGKGYITRDVAQLKSVKKGATITETAKLAAMSILSQNNLELIDNKQDYVLAPKGQMGLYAINGNLPSGGDIDFHGKFNTPETSAAFANKMCTEVPINLTKIMNIEIWGKGKVKNGKLPVCSVYISAIASKQSS